MGQEKSKPKNQNSLKSFITDNVKQSNSASSSVQVKTPEMIIFGINAQNRPSIFGFDSTTELLSDFKMKNESQYRLFNYSQAVNLNDYLIIVTGGTTKDKNQTSGNAGIINLETGEWQDLPNMNQPRFSHISIFYDDKIFAFGGRSKPGDENILNHCEYLSIISIENEFEFGNNWIEMPKSLLKRCTGFSIVYNDEIYLIGGYTGQRKRSKKIEKFNRQANMWQFIELRLLYGVERGIILSGKVNEFIIFGGKIRSGDTKQVYVYDLLTQSYSYINEMNYERVLQKGFQSRNGNIYMLGGDVDLTSEKTRPTITKNWVWSKFNVPLKSMIGDQLKPYNHSQRTVILSIDNEPKNIIAVNNENHNVLFGNDAEPFISIIYKDDGKVVWKNVPTPLRLYGYQGGVRIDNFRYFLCGGLFFSRKKIARDAYLYNSNTHQVEKLMKMLGVRYTMNIVYLKNYVYVLGGRSYGADSEGILQSCERFNLELKSWDVIAPMNYSRCTAMSFVIDNRIYIAGGYKGNMLRETKFEFYDETLNTWNLLAVELTEPLEASLVISLDNKVAFLGGRNKLGDSSGALIYDFTYGIDTMHLESKSNLITKKCLHKAIKLDQKQILLLGGENFEQSFFEFITIDDCKGIISNPIDLVSKNKVTIAKNIKNEIMNNVKDSKLHKYCFL